MDKKIKHKLNELDSQKSVNVDGYDKIGLNQSNNPLPVGEINRILNVGDQFNTERQNSTIYRLNGVISNLFNNVLYNSTGLNSKETVLVNEDFRDKSYPNNGANANDGEDLTYSQALREYIINIDGWSGYYQPNIIGNTDCKFTDMEPNSTLFEFTPKNRIKNWGLTVTYPAYSADTQMTDGGLLIIDKQIVNVGNKQMIAFTTPVIHGLKQRDNVKLINLSNSNLNGLYTVIRVGLDDGSLRSHTFVVDIDTNINISNTRMKKVVRGQESDYYYRIFKKVPTTTSDIIEDDDYEIYPLHFSKTLYNDQNVQFVFNQDIDVGNIVDNLGRPISELYLSIIKNDNNGFTNIKSGIDIPFIDSTKNYINEVPDIRRIHNGTTPTPNGPLDIVSMSDDEFYGDVVTYNKFEVREEILATVSHRFNTQNRLDGGTIYDPKSIEEPIDMGNRVEGYLYKPHYQIKIREYSDYIEQGDSSTEGIPNYAENLGDGRFLWRDFLDIGFSDISNQPIDYPFLNGAHYIFNNYCIPLRRQDPFGLYGLYYSNFPRDNYGEGADNNFIINNKQDAC